MVILAPYGSRVHERRAAPRYQALGCIDSRWSKISGTVIQGVIGA